MIVYSLKCENSHEFEDWFSSSAAFDRCVLLCTAGAPLPCYAKGPQQGPSPGRVRLGEGLTEEFHGAGRGRVQAHHVAQQRALAAARSADDEEDFPVRDGEGNVLQDHLGVVAAFQVRDLDGGPGGGGGGCDGLRHGVRVPAR